LGIGFLDNENTVFAFGKQGVDTSSSPTLTDYVLTFFNSGDMSINYNYNILGYYDYSTNHMDLKASGTDYLVFLTGAGPPDTSTPARS
jgi:hypothetical protein